MKLRLSIAILNTRQLKSLLIPDQGQSGNTFRREILPLPGKLSALD